MPASFLLRALAYAFDVVAAGAVTSLGIILASEVGIGRFFALWNADWAGRPPTNPADAAALASGSVLLMLSFIAVPAAFAACVRARGGTPGKISLALSVRDYATGGCPGFSRAFLREALRLLPVPFLAAPLSPVGVFLGFVIWSDARRNGASRRTWYDRLTGTVVVAPAALAERGDEPDEGS